MPFVFVALFVFGGMAALSLLGCGDSYTADDKAANAIAARHEVRSYDMCSTDDAGTCTAAAVRAHAALAYCANAREIAAHGGQVPEGGVSCQP